MKNFKLINRLLSNSHEKQTPQRFGRYAVMLLMLLTLGVGQMWANDATNARIYFDNTNTGWSYVQLVGGHDSWSSGTEFSLISGTNNLWTNTFSWGGYTYFMFIEASGAWPGEGKEAWNRKGDLNYSATISDNVGSNTYLYAPTSSAKNTGYDPSGSITSYSSLNYNQTIYKCVSTNGSTPAKSTANIATVSITTKRLKNATATEDNNGSIGSGSNYVTKSAARTATVTMSVSSINSSYVWLGWYDAESGGNMIESNTSYIYNASGTKTVYPRFATKFTVGKKLYLKPNSDWKSDNARFAACFGAASGQTWVDFTQVGTSDYYYVEVPSGSWGYVIFCRMDGSTATNNWDNKWNQTDDMLASDTKNGAEITGWNNSQNWITVYDGLSVARNIDAAANAPTITNSQTATKATTSITVNAQTEKTGYDWVRWTSSGSGTFGTATNRSTTFTPAASDEVATANYAEKTYSLIFSHNGHGSIAVGGNTVASGSTASVNYHTTKTLVATNNTGYHFTGWTLSGTNTNKVTIADMTSSGASTSIKATATGATVTAGFDANTYTITLDDDGDYGGPGSATATYNEATLSISSNPTRDDYRINGFYAPGTGDLIADASGNLQASKNANTGSGNFAVTDANGKWIYDGNLTLYAHWTYDVTEYEVNFGVESGSSSFGSLTAYDNNTSSYISTGSDVRSGHGLTFTASPNTGYEVEGWYTDAACTSGKHDEGETTYSIASLSGAANVYVKFKEIEWSVAFAAGTGGSVTTPNSTPQTVGQVTGISIAATPSSGYTFNRWTSSSGGSFTSAVTTNSNTFKPTANTTVTASFTETKHTITINGGTAASTTAGVATTGSATAAAPAAGKKFTGWTLGDGVALSGGALTDRTINFTATQASSVTANYADRASVKMYFAKPTTLGWSKVYAYAWGPSGHNDTYPGVELSTTEVINCVTYYIYQYYTEADGIGGAATGDATWNKIVFGDNNDARKTGDLNIADGHYYYRATTANTSGKSSAITAAWYIKGTMNSWGETDPITHDCVNNKGTVNINLTKGNTYEFKVYNEVNNQMWSNSTACGTSSGDHTITETMASAETLYNDDANVMKVTANVTGPYTFEVSATNASNPKIKVTFPVSYTVNFGVSPAAAADAPTNSLSISSGSLVLSGTSITFTKDPTPNGGYTWSHWEKNSSNVGTGNTYTTTISGTTTVNAVYTEDTHTVTLANGGHGHVEIGGATVTSVGGVGIATASGTITAVPDPGYYFTGWTGSDINNGVTIASGTTSSASITINATADSKTITANFAPIWRIAGGDAANTDPDDAMGNWSTTANQITNITTSAGVMTSGYVEMTLPANTEYVFKVFNASTNKYWGKTSTVTKMEYSNRATAVTLTNDDGSNQTFRTAAAGTYRFTWTGSQITIGYPASCKVTFGKGTGGLTITASGSTTGSISSGDYVASGEDVTFTETHTTPGYTLTGWYTTKDTGGSSVTGMSTSDFVLDDIAADATVWSRYSENMTTVSLIASPTGKGTFTSGGDAVTSVLAGVTTKPAVTAVPATGYRVNTSATVWSKDNNYVTLSSTTANPVTITGTGTTGNTTALTATFTPNEYTITLNQNGATTESDPTSLTATYDATAPVYDAGASAYKYTITNPEKTGYTFAGWFENEGGAGHEIITQYGFFKHEDNPYVDATGHWKHDGSVTVYAKWTANNYAVTMSTTEETGYGSNAPANQTATYGAAMPTITPPTPAAGYKFMGYFSDHNGAGTKYYNADGSSARTWNIAEATTLYAHFQKTVISSLEHPAAVASGEEITVDVNPVLNQTGAQDYMDICWSFLYDNNVEVESGWAVAANPVAGKPNQVQFTLTGISSGYYQIKAVLKANGSSFDACSTGTELSTIKSNITIAGNSKVTIQYQDASGNAIAANGTVEVARGETVDVTAPELIGYEFSTWALGDVLHTEGALTDNPITISADYDGYLTAKYNKKQMIYFNNTLEWDTVYVYFYNNGTYWGSDQGTGADVSYFSGAYTGKYGGMTKIPGTNVYYFDLAANSVSTSLTHVVFTEEKQDGYGYFSHNNVIKLSDYSATLSMYVPLTGQTPEEKNKPDNTSNYYWKGYWLNYPENTGYTLKIFDHTGDGASLVKERDFPFSADKAMPMSVTVDLEGGNKTYGFKIYRAGGTWFRNGGTMTNGHSGDEGQAAWVFGTESGTNCGLTTTSAGNYTFKVWVNSDGNHQVGVHYPESTGDFRVMYTDDVRKANHGGSEGASWLLSSVIPGNTASDTISYFVRAENSKNPKYKIQKCTISEDPLHPGAEEYKTVSWADQGTAIDVPDSITENGVYNFIFAKEDGNLVLKKIELYEGNFYIRVDGAGSSNWDNFRASDHLMPYSDYSFSQTENPYSHYFTQWYKVEKVGGDVKVKNIKFVVANDYSVNVSDTIVQDDVAGAYVDANGYITRSANIRFMYNYKTNEATRRYVDGAQESGSEFLMIIPGNSKIYAAAEGGDPLTQLTFSDKGNWVYEANVYALPTATYKLKSKFGATATGDASKDWERKGEIIQYFKGGESSTETLIGGNSESTTRVQIRLLYDFKTNRVVAAYQPSSGTIDANMEINADIMFMREHQGDIEQITFAEGKSISAIENIYCCLKFNKYTLNNLDKNDPSKLLSPLLSRYERDIFYVSFPYDVRVSDIIGFGTYGQHWIVEYYDGAARAEKGFWKDTETYWRFVTPAMKDTFTLKAGTGYIVALDLDEMWYINDTYHADIWNNTTEVELLFPGDISSISDQAVTYTMPEHTCTINRGTASGNRTKKDSHWNVLGVPTFKNITGAASEAVPEDGGGSGAIVFDNTAWIKELDNDLRFIYDGNLADNSLTPKAVKNFEFKALHAYVVQYCGDVTFSTSSAPAPSPIVARSTYAEAPQEVDFRLELNKNGVMEDQTFISLSNDENVSAGFAFGEDLSKEFNTNRANIYTFIGTEWVAGNTLPMSEQTTVVPVGIKIASAGDYTFAIPEGTNGVGVTLIDNETGIRTSLSALDYTINLPAGTYDNRFVLEISPIVQSPTGIESTEHRTQNADVHKVLIDNILYIVKDGVMYDARGARVQ